MISKFKQGDLIIPDDDVMSAFVYDINNTELYAGIEYRLATSAEFVYFSKYRNMTEVKNGIEAYKRDNSKKVTEVYQSIDKAKKNEKKQGMS